jgi:hypothetical protein
MLACDGGSTGPEGLCLAVVNVGGVFYTTPASPPSVAPADVSDLFLEVTRDTGCLDQGEPSDELASGESNFLPAGTALHRVVGFEPEERLTYWAPVVQEWLPLAPL